jgi:hypothetical protein
MPIPFINFGGEKFGWNLMKDIVIREFISMLEQKQVINIMKKR